MSNKTWVTKAGGEDIAFHYKNNKRKWTILFIHGIASTHEFADNFLDDETHFNVISISLPGSRHSPTDEKLTIDLFASVASDFINKYVKTKNLILFGHSLGGGTVSKIGSSLKKVKKIFFMSTINPGMINSKIWKVIENFYYPKNSIHAIIGSFIQTSGKIYNTFVAKNPGIKEIMGDNLKYESLLKNYVAKKEYMEKVLDENYKSCLTKELIFLVGSEDPIISPKHFKEYVESIDQEITIIEGAGHNPIDDNPDLVRKIIHDNISDEKKSTFKFWDRPISKKALVKSYNEDSNNQKQTA